MTNNLWYSITVSPSYNQWNLIAEEPSSSLISTHSLPSAKLAHSMISRALQDMELDMGISRNLGKETTDLILRAREWFEDPHHPPYPDGISLNWCCESLNIDTDVIRDFALGDKKYGRRIRTETTR